MDWPTIWLIAEIVAIAGYVLGFWAACHAIMYKRDPRSAGVWVLLCIMLPLVGAWLYWNVGINRMERRAVRRFGRRIRPFRAEAVRESPADALDGSVAIGHLKPLRVVADRVTRFPLLAGNSVVPLHNGEQTYPRMLKAIDEAERSLTMASYIFRWDDVGQTFADALERAARRGVRVHLLVDGVGAVESFSRMGRRLLKTGVELASFFPLRFPFGRLRINLRNHRKILVADGRIGFTGGMNIGADHYVDRGGPKVVEDLQFEITGPVLAELQHTFVEDWALATEVVLDGEAYFPELKPTGEAMCRGIVSGPDADFEMIHWILLGAVSAATKSVWIATPYFVPTSPLIAALAMASMRNVRVTLFLPSVLDYPSLGWAADAYLWQLLEHGVRVYRRGPPFVHTKLVIVDDRWLMFGSANMDRRSFRLNFEFNVEAYDETLARSLAGWMEGLIPISKEVTLREMDARPHWRRFRDGFMKMFSPHL